MQPFIFRRSQECFFVAIDFWLKKMFWASTKDINTLCQVIFGRGLTQLSHVFASGGALAPPLSGGYTPAARERSTLASSRCAFAEQAPKPSIPYTLFPYW